MTLRVWWVTELYPDNAEESIGIAGEFPVVRLADLREVVKRVERISQISTMEGDVFDPIGSVLRIRQIATNLLAQLNGVNDESIDQA